MTKGDGAVTAPEGGGERPNVGHADDGSSGVGPTTPAGHPSTGSVPGNTAGVDILGRLDKGKGDVAAQVDILEKLDKDKREAGLSQALSDRMFTGAIIFFVIAGLALVFFAGLAVVTGATMPTPAMVNDLMPTGTADERLQAYHDLHSAWVQQTTTLGQLVLFGSIIPLISTIIGYVLGSESKRRAA